ncbi:5263_t:CDS:2 [Cetraspora pellucida]|uniref:5263_t:CDS:1 n=1 Tax=Cetraspora pellucida TaxID=1433469 RepID=A0A9N9JHP9_9GLOM|nr:5263_t:CDS:2 [Cetraspora pellucida]
MSNKYLDDMVEDTNIGGSEFSSGSPVKPFFKTELINNTEFCVCHHKVYKAMIESGRVKIITKDNDKFEFSIMAESSQSTIIQVLNKIKKYPFNHPKQKKLNSNTAAFIVEDLQPFSELLINSEDKILKNIHEYAIDDNEINNGDPYIGLTLHWINDNFQIKEIIGTISYLPYPYTAECLLNKIVEILDSLKLKNITVCGTVDNRSNIKSCLEKLDRKYGIYKYKLLLVEANDNNLLKNYEEKELLSDDWDKVTELVKLLHPYEIISKKLSGLQYPTLLQAWFAITFIKTKLNCVKTNDTNLAAFFDPRTKDMPIFTKNERSHTILEACVEFELNSNSRKLDTLSDTESQIDLTLSSDKINDEDIFALPTDTSS